MKKLFHLIDETAGSMIKYLEQQFSHDTKTKTIFVRDIALRYTTDIISSVAFGIKVNSFDPETVQFFEKGICQTFFDAVYYLILLSSCKLERSRIYCVSSFLLRKSSRRHSNNVSSCYPIWLYVLLSTIFEMDCRSNARIVYKLLP